MKLLSLLLGAVLVALGQSQLWLNWHTQWTANWWHSLDNAGWSRCGNGGAIIGLYRNTCHYLHCIEYARCTRPGGRPTNVCFARAINGYTKGVKQCGGDYLVSGFHRNHVDHMGGITHLWCCTVSGSYVYSRHSNNWWASFDKKGWSWVAGHTFMYGYYKNTCHWIYCLELAYSARVRLMPWTSHTTANWWHSLDNNGLSRCPYGKVIIGLYRNTCHYLHCIEYARCAYPGGRKATQCGYHNYKSPAAASAKGVRSCGGYYYLAGLYRYSVDDLRGIRYLYCCQVPYHRITSRYTNNWWASFDKKGWSWVYSNTYMYGYYKNTCHWIYCLEYAYSANIVPFHNYASICQNAKYVAHPEKRLASVYYPGFLRCDKNDINPGWYYFAGRKRIARGVVPIKRCGTHAPGSIHAAVTPFGQAKSLKVCYHWSSNNCLWSNYVTEINCGHNHFVYYLRKPPTCWLRYCN